MASHQLVLAVVGPWSMETSKQFWESFTPTAIPAGHARGVLHARFLSEHDWTPVETTVTQDAQRARIDVSGRGDLDSAAA